MSLMLCHPQNKKLKLAKFNIWKKERWSLIEVQKPKQILRQSRENIKFNTFIKFLGILRQSRENIKFNTFIKFLGFPSSNMNEYSSVFETLILYLLSLFVSFPSLEVPFSRRREQKHTI
jgi:hypothetical protein